MAHTLSDLVKKTGAKRRAIQVWADSGVLQSLAGTDRAGTGVNREYDDVEMAIAALLVPLANMGVPIGHIKAFSASIRPTVNITPGIGQVIAHPAGLRQIVDEYKPLVLAFRRAAIGEGENHLCFAMAPNGIWLDAKTDEHGPICISPSRDLPAEYKALRPAPAVIVLDLTDLLSGLLT